MSNRKALPLPTERAVLVKSRRRCCLCFWLEGIDEVQRGQIAHLDHDRENHNEDNLCFLCTKEHHDDYDSTRSQSKGLQKGEVKHYREELYKEMELRFHALEVERKLRLSKQKLREIAHEGLLIRAGSKFSEAKLKDWRERAITIVKNIAGAPAEFDFLHCTEGSGMSADTSEINFEKVAGPRTFLYIHANFIKELAREMDATDLIESEAGT